MTHFNKLVILFFCFSCWTISSAFGQEEILQVSIAEGTINGIKPTESIEKIKEAFPFFTGETEEHQGFNCGGGVFFLNHDFYAYTGNDYWEIRDEFKGSFDMDVLGKNIKDVLKIMGKAKKTFTNEYGIKYYYFKTKYGCCVLNVKNDYVKMADLYWKKIKDVKLCY